MNTLISLLRTSQRQENDELFIHSRAPILGTFRENGQFKLTATGNHVFFERGTGPAIIFCPGLFGSLHNTFEIGVALSTHYRFIVPCMPLYDMPLVQCTVPRLGDYLQTLMDDMAIREAVMIGNSLGGGASLYYALKECHCLKGLVLCGSSGLSTLPMQKGFFKRKEFPFVRKMIGDVFYNPQTPSDEMVTEVFDALQRYEIVLRSIRFTKSTARDHLHDRLHTIDIPTLLIWGYQDRITPPEIGIQFLDKIPNAELHFIDQCGHVPPQEHPELVLERINSFLSGIGYR